MLKDRKSRILLWLTLLPLRDSPPPPKVVRAPPMSIISVSEVTTAGGADTVATHISRSSSHTQVWTLRPLIGYSHSAGAIAAVGRENRNHAGLSYKVVKPLF